jgi:hypothetical protein
MSDSELRELGFSEHTYSEILLTLARDDEINVAPMGVLLAGEGLLRVKVYVGSRTYCLLDMGAKECVLNVTRDPILFYRAIFEKGKIRYTNSKKISAPRVKGCDGYVECRVASLNKSEGCYEVMLKPILIEVSSRKVRTYARVETAIIEALICYTKLSHFRAANPRKARELFRRVRIFEEIAYRSTRDEAMRRIVRNIVEEGRRVFRT